MLKGLFERVLRARFAFPAILLGAGMLLLISETSYDQARDAVLATRQHVQARVDMTRVLQLVTDAETAQRGFVLTGSDDFLVPYQTAVQAMPKAHRAVASYLEKTGQLAAAAELARLIENKMSEVQTTVSLRSSGSESASRTIVQSGIGKERMEEMRSLMDGLLARASDAAEVSRGTTLRALALNRFGVATLLALAVLGLFLYLQQVRALEKAREAQRQFLQGERERLEREVGARTGELRELARHLQSAREDERGRLARELHDELGGLLTAAKLDVARLRSKTGDQPDVASRLAHLTQCLNDGIALKRRIIEDLRPSALNNLGLETALEILCREMSERLSIPVEAQLEPLRLTSPTDLTVYRFVQEALTNIGKYAHASRVSVSLSSTPEGVCVQVSDDGEGFDAAASLVGHHGLAGMRFRVESLGGEMEVDSAPGRGTTLRARLPNATETADTGAAREDMA
jgi:signal transduction histidine kinase